LSIHHQIDLVEFPASSPEEAKAVSVFFATAFGWEFKEWGPEYLDTHDSGVVAGINGGSTKEQTMPLAVVYSDDLEATEGRVEAAGGEVTHPITAFPGGRRFAFTDPAGNQLAVWSDK
jgi:uncharacterized protein